MKKLVATLALALAANGALADETIPNFSNLAVLVAVADAAATFQRGGYPFFMRGQAGKRFELSVDTANRELFSRMNERLDEKLDSSNATLEIPLQSVNLVF